MPLYPTEKIIWDENIVPTEYYSGEGMISSSVNAEQDSKYWGKKRSSDVCVHSVLGAYMQSFDILWYLRVRSGFFEL